MLQFFSIMMMALFIILVFPQRASAHCDTMDGPTASDGKKALESKNLNYALKWISPDYDEELRKIFDLSVKVRALGSDAQELADRYFLENLVRIHRAGEGEPFEGLKPSGTPIDEKVLAADKCIEIGNLSPLEGLMQHEQMHELEERFEKVLSLKNYEVNDVAAGRSYIEAYVNFFKFAEGEVHEHGKHNEHGHPMMHGH
jgi:hypothetical protein